jgi:hypothetical protein
LVNRAIRRRLVRSTPPGEHTLDLRIDRKGSTALSVALQSGDSATFECEPGGGAVTASVDLVRDRPWVTLRRVCPDR